MNEYGLLLILIFGIILGIAITRFIIWIKIKWNDSQIIKDTERDNSDELSTKWEDEIIKSLSNRGIQEAGIAFWLSILSGIIAFTMIIGTIAYIIITKDMTYFAYINIIASVILESSSILFMRQAKDYRKLMIEYFDRLKIEKNIKKAEKITDKITNEILRSKIYSILSLNLARAHGSDQIGLKIIETIDDNYLILNNNKNKKMNKKIIK